MSSVPPIRARVSVVVIFLNAEAFLAEAVESILGQTYDNYEVLLVDDGSTDRSTAIAHAFAAEHATRIRYIEHPGHENRGMSASRNLGITESRGEYVAFLDSDDAWLPEKLASQVHVLDTHPNVAMTYGPARFWFSWTGHAEDLARDFDQELGFAADSVVGPPRAIRSFVEDDMTVPCPSGVLLRRDACLRVGGFADSFTNLHEDQVFYARLCSAERVFVATAGGYLYRQHDGSSCALADDAGVFPAARLRFLTWLDGYLKSVPTRDAVTWWGLLRLRQFVAAQLEPQRHPRRHRFRMRFRRLRNRIAARARYVLAHGRP